MICRFIDDNYYRYNNDIIYAILKNKPVSISTICFQYLLLWRRLTSHYVSLYVVQSLIFGNPIRPVPLLQVLHIIIIL